ncbi:lycopene cyclase family protein [Cognatishimia sp.]|uniref:lycopene cyclase family protein n=1 Tax=Cognatishimia sp. TaxID=2211648 RepID=UPI00351849FF|nr:hypothetical protein [Cognatishimia sp.]
MTDDVDIAILGGGCAGLSLGRELVASGFDGKAVIVEPRTSYHHDRTWGFWAPRNHDFGHLVTKTWPNWSISTVDQRVTMSGREYSYQQICSDSFYADAVDCIQSKANMTLMTGTIAHGVRSHHSYVEVNTDAGTINAKHVVDTRPRTKGEDAALIWQVFSGAEIEVDRDVFDPTTAGLMDGLTGSDQGLKFTYCLPTTQRHALIQTTWFMTNRIPPAKLNGEFHRDLKNHLGIQYRVVREERGALPMGQDTLVKPVDGRVIRAGQAAGALRASSGYGFWRIQDWARNAATEFASGRVPKPHRYESYFNAAMDRVFLHALRRTPRQSPDWFMSMAKQLCGADFARFMMGKTNAAIWAKLLWSLPKSPFLATLFYGAGTGHQHKISTETAPR